MKSGYLVLGIFLLGIGLSLFYMHISGYTIREVTTTTTSYTTVTEYVTVTEHYPLSSFPKLKNVKISIEKISFNVSELWIIDTTEDVVFNAGKCTRLASGMSVMMVFYNGTARTTLLLSGTTICPESILLEVSAYTYKEKPIPEWRQEYWNPPPPKWIEPTKPDYPSLAYILLAGITVLAGLTTLLHSLAKREE